GAFLMGSNDPKRDNEHPVHEVELSPYFLGKYEVTVAQFERFVAATDYRTHAELEGVGNVITAEARDQDEGAPLAGARWRMPHVGLERAGPDLPVVQVTWDDAERYCAWAGLALPTEAQWERAAGWEAKTKKRRRYPWGEEVPGAVPGAFAN